MAYDSVEMYARYGMDFTNTMHQTEFNSMVGSVIKYKGFYVGRYETGGFNRGSTTIVVKAGEIGTDDINKSNNSINWIGWYKAYKNQKAFKSSDANVASSMIWGSQWNQVMKFVNGKTDGAGNPYNVTIPNSNRHKTSITKTGSNINDKVQNIYDLEGNVVEWTQEANRNDLRVTCGGTYGNSDYRSAAHGGGSTVSGTVMQFRNTCYTIHKIMDQGT